MPDIGTAVSYLLAVVDLTEVKSIRNAIKANLIAKGGIEGPLGNVEMPHRDPPLRNLESNIRFDRRPLVQTYLPRPEVRSETVVERVRAVPAADRIEATDCEPHTTAKEGPLAPPWRLPLVPEDTSVRPVIKCAPKPPDVISKGSLLDFFL